jgi:hypothetical protein
MENDLESRVIGLLSRFTGIGAGKISSSSSITDHLGIGGDDGRDFMIEFSKEFDVDITDFEFDRYFGCEPGFSLHLVLVALACVMTGIMIAVISPALFVFLSIIFFMKILLWPTSGGTALSSLTVADLMDLAKKGQKISGFSRLDPGCGK